MAPVVHDGKPFQLKFVRAAQMLLFSNALCDPPLGQATVVPAGQDAVKFTVLLESSKSFPEQNWEAALWHNGNENQEWKELALQESFARDQPLVIETDSRPRVYRRWFSISLPTPARPGPLYFTLKFRLTSSDTWRWVNEHCNQKDGALFFQSPTPPAGLENYLKGYSQDLSVSQVESETPDTQLWSLTSPVAAADGKASGFTDTNLGTPRSFSRWFSLVRLWSPWLGPRHGASQFSPTEDAVLASFLRMDGRHLVLLAVSGVDEVLTVFKPDHHGNVIVHSRNDNEERGHARVLASVGSTFSTAMAAVMYHARKVVRGYDTMSKPDREEMQHALDEDVRPEYMDNWYDGLTYCTWNALGQNLHEQRIFDALDVLKENKIEITNLIIDDNWQSLDNRGQSQFKRGWTDFDANKEAVWHALLGYWGGVSPDGNLAKTYKTRSVRKAEGLAGGEMTVIHEDDVPRMYDDFYRFLLDSGIDSVKTDAQFFLDLMDDADDRRRFMKTYQDAWTIASLRYFSIKAISCMSQLPQILFHTQLDTSKPRLMVRNSDDFFPDVPSSHPFHIFTNALTALLTCHLNVLPDWDMFQTSHPYSSFHAAARAISGGPIYITDTPGQHSLPLISSMTAKTISPNAPRTIILRPNNIAKCIEQGVYVPYQDHHFLQVGNYHSGSTAGYGVGLLGVFNVSEQALTELIPLAHFPGTREEQKYIVRAVPSGDISAPISLDSEFPVVNLALEEKGWNILTAYPLLSSSASSSMPLSPSLSTANATEVAVLGLLQKLSGACAVVGTPKLEAHIDNGLKLRTRLKALGVLGIWMPSLANWAENWKDHILVSIRDQIIPVHTVKVADDNNQVLEIDVETAWEEMGLVAGYGREFEVVVMVH